MTLLIVPKVTSVLLVLVPEESNKEIHCMHICHLLGILVQGSWKLLDKLEDPELKVLASKLRT